MENFRNFVGFIGRLTASILFIALFEGIITLGYAFRFEEYTAIGYIFQSMMFVLAVWMATEWYYDTVKS